MTNTDKPVSSFKVTSELYSIFGLMLDWCWFCAGLSSLKLLSVLEVSEVLDFLNLFFREKTVTAALTSEAILGEFKQTIELFHRNIYNTTAGAALNHFFISQKNTSFS